VGKYTYALLIRSDPNTNIQIAGVVRVRVPSFAHQEGARRGAHTCWVPVAGEGAGEGLARGPTKTCAPRVGRRAAAVIAKLPPRERTKESARARGVNVWGGKKRQGVESVSQ